MLYGMERSQASLCLGFSGRKVRVRHQTLATRTAPDVSLQSVWILPSSRGLGDILWSRKRRGVEEGQGLLGAGLVLWVQAVQLHKAPYLEGPCHCLTI